MKKSSSSLLSATFVIVLISIFVISLIYLNDKAKNKYFDTEKGKFYDYKSIGLNNENIEIIDKMVDDWLAQYTDSFAYGGKAIYTQDEWERFNDNIIREANNRLYDQSEPSIIPKPIPKPVKLPLSLIIPWGKPHSTYETFRKVINNFNIQDKQSILNFVIKNINNDNALTQTFSLINKALEEQYGDNIISVDYYSGLAIIGKIQKDYYVANGTIKNYSNNTYTDISVNFSVYNNSSICGNAYAFCNSLSPNQTWQFTTSCMTENWNNLLIYEVEHD